MNKEVLSLLNEQIWLENTASFFYLKVREYRILFLLKTI
jgi:ferritin